MNSKADFERETMNWEKTTELLWLVFQTQQPKMLVSLKSISSKARFFELSRFDFIVDDNLNVFLMEQFHKYRHEES
ncbi:hypothetical protein DICVIV_05452 [Dictyocaulus viviparus]|uniref:Uncharacterized protein n=1 Tax=Dictyocaulus viviparus TaxID=29172 RepID=A0A0D8XV27_DICVI|nr:hypothetical protein DICVIV_05452 [Dictyocaulus viviparus]